MNGFWSDYPSIATDLKEISAILVNRPKTGLESFDRTLSELFAAEGKLLRPAFVLIGASLGEDTLSAETRSRVLNLALSIEMLHMATLIHDDIIDEAKIRRGMPSIQTRYGKDYAVYTGDFLLSQSLLMLSQSDFPQDIRGRLAAVMQRICISEMRQFEMRYHFDVGFKTYLKIISGKTAALFAASLCSGAHLVGASEDLIKRLARIGYAIGMCFQIQDDILDVTSESVAFKKDILSDLAQGYITLPIIFGLKSKDKGRLRLLLKAKSVKVVEIKTLLRTSGAIDESWKLAKRYADRATQSVLQIPDGSTKEYLLSLLPKILNRAY